MKKKTPSAGARIAAQKKKLVWATFSEADQKKIRMAAASQNISMAQFVTVSALTAAEKILEKNGIVA